MNMNIASRDIFWTIAVGIEGEDEEQSNWIMDIL